MHLSKKFIEEDEDFSYILDEEEEEESDDDFEDDEESGDDLGDSGKSDNESEETTEDPYKDLSPEELVEQLKAKDQKINKIVGDLRSKKNKERSLSSKEDESKKGGDEDDDEGDETPDPLQVVLERVQTLEQRLVNGGTEDPEVVVGEALDVAYDTPWGSIYSPENDINGDQFKELKSAYDMIKDRYPHRTKEEALQVLKRAHFIANPDALSDRKLSPAKPNSADAGNLGGSSERGEKGGARYTAEQAELARKFGNDPEVVYK